MRDNRTGIQTEKSVPPWEQAGRFRLDCEPYRGELLWWLSCASFVVGVFALIPCLGWMPGLIGIPFGLFNRHLAKGNLAKIRAGLMDPTGAVATADAENLSTLGLCFSLTGTVVWGGMCLFLSWITGPGPR